MFGFMGYFQQQQCLHIVVSHFTLIRLPVSISKIGMSPHLQSLFALKPKQLPIKHLEKDVAVGFGINILTF